MRLLLFIPGIFAGILCAASPGLAQGASRSAAHQRQHVRAGSEANDSRAFTSPPRDPRSWVGDPAGRPYHYDPGFAPNGQ